MNKKAIVILVCMFVLILVAGGVLFYLWKFKTPQDTAGNPQVPGNVATSTPKTSPVTTIKETSLYSGTVISPMITASNTLAFFNQNAQLVQGVLQKDATTGRYTFSPRVSTLGRDTGINRVLWGDAEGEFILEYISGEGKSYLYYSIKSQQLVAFPKQITQLAWIPGAGRVLYFWKGLDNKMAAYTAKPDNTDFRRVSDIWETDNAFAVSPDGSAALLWRTGVGASTAKIVYMSLDGKEFKNVTQDGFDQGALWHPDSQQFLFTRQDSKSKQAQLWLSSISDVNSAKNLGLYGNVDTAVWSKDGSNLYLFASADPSAPLKLYKITLASLNKLEVISINQKPRFLALAPGEDILLWVGTDGKLNLVPLPVQQ